MTNPVYQPNPRSEFRVKFDFRVEFTNGGFVEGRDFLLDLEGTEVSDADLAEMIVEAMNLARAGRVRVRRKRVVRRGEHDDPAPASRPCWDRPPPAGRSTAGACPGARWRIGRGRGAASDGGRRFSAACAPACPSGSWPTSRENRSPGVWLPRGGPSLPRGAREAPM